MPRLTVERYNLGITDVLLVFCVVDLVIGAYRPLLKTSIPGISELNLVIFILMLLCINRIVIFNNKLLINDHDKYILFFSIYCFLMMIYSVILNNFNFIGELISFKNYINAFIIYFLFKNAIDNINQINLLVKTLIFILVLSSIIGIIGFFIFPDIFAKKTTLKSIINQPSLSAMFMITLFPLVWIYIENIAKKLIFILIILIALFQTGSRGALLSVSLVFILFIIEKNVNVKILFLSLFAVSCVLVLIHLSPFKTAGVFDRIAMDPGTDLSTYSSGRWGAWKGILEAIKGRPFFGYGFDSFNRVYAERAWGKEMATHNEYLHILFTLGIVGLVLYALIYYKIWTFLMRQNDLTLSKAFRYGVTAFLIHITFSNPFVVRYILWLIIAVAMSNIELNTKESSDIQ